VTTFVLTARPPLDEIGGAEHEEPSFGIEVPGVAGGQSGRMPLEDPPALGVLGRESVSVGLAQRSIGQRCR
jgi:hypothetical protein